MVLTKDNSHPAAVRPCQRTGPGRAQLEASRAIRPAGAARGRCRGAGVRLNALPPASCGLAAGWLGAFWLTEVSEFLFCCQILKAANQVYGKT